MRATTITYRAFCTGCRTRLPKTTVLAVVAEAAKQHEATTGHRVMVADGPTSHVPRDWWTDQPAPTASVQS